MELHTINQNEAGIRLGMADYYNGYKMSIPNTSMKIAGESIEDLHISDRIPHILRGTYLTVSNADVTRPCEIIGLQGGSATGTNEIKVDILPIQIADTTRDGLSITRDDRDITINGKCEPTGTIKTGTTVTHSNATDWARLNSFTNSNVSSTVEGTSFTLTDASSTKQASILELKGNTTQEGTPTPSSPVDIETVSGDNNIVVSNKNIFDYENTTVSNSYSTMGTKTDNGYQGGWAYYINLPRPILAGTYFVSFIVEEADNNATANMRFIGKGGSSGTVLAQINCHSNYSASLTFSEDVYSLRVDNGKKAETTLIKNIQVEKRHTGNRLHTTSR